MNARIVDLNLEQFRKALLAWYTANQRDLPWRRTRDPYRIWVSEIMLQQTRVAAMVVRYAEFLKRFPSVEALAVANEASVLAAWSGLGYYRRARSLHAAAQKIVKENRGVLPQDAEGWRQLPGVGRYTAAAISSIAFSDPVAVVDGNVERVLGRVLGRRKEDIWRAAQRLLDCQHPGEFNQAMMELGATVCLPGEPRCQECPIRKFCRTRGRGSIRSRKVPQRKKTLTYGLIRRADSIRMVKRADSHSLMPGMWELPEASSSRPMLFSLRHSITMTDYTVRVVEEQRPRAGTWVRVSRLSELPLTGLARKILRTAEVIQ